MQITVLCYPKCTTCQKALAWLSSKGVSYAYRNIKEENPSYEELKAWHAKSGLTLKSFFNTSGLSYKALGLKKKLPAMGEEEALRLLASDGMLVKRPLVITDAFVLAGFREAVWESAFPR
ncbi:MAG: arsenate reductase family protein [Eubacteriales bacterium]|nr:arsenate reductase family protein [Eubacteriales bacterium]